MAFNSPLSLVKADRLIAVMGLAAGDRVIDVGCGEGTFLMRLVAATGAVGLGIDIDASLIAAAQQASAQQGPAALEWRVADIQQEALPDNAFTAAVCLGATHAFGSGDVAYPRALAALTKLVRPGGQLLIGEGYWKRPPDPAYRELIGEPIGIYHDHAGNVAAGEAMGLIPLYAAVSNDDEWDDFEWSHRRWFELAAAAAPDDATVAERLHHSRAWRDGYLRWGRTTMGFGFYLFHKP